MKRGWLTAGAVVVAMLGVAAVAQARGPQGLQGRQLLQSQVRNGTCLMTTPGTMGGRGMMGGWMAGGRGMMGGMMGGMMMGGQFADPAALAAHLEAMIPQHESVLASLEERLAAETDEATKAILTRQVEWHKLTLDWMQGRLPVAQACVLSSEIPWSDQRFFPDVIIGFSLARS